MDRKSFEAELERDGFGEAVEVQYAEAQQRPPHSHTFDVRAMVLDGQITLTVDGVATTYRAGDRFSMAAGCMHAEDIAAGMRSVVGRR